MPLMEEEPPSTFPLGQCRRLPPSPGSGSLSKNQLKRGLFMGSEKADGMRMKGCRSLPPASRSRTLWLPSSLNRFASTQPAEPAPAMM